jgi:hypothetical protein
MKKEGAAIPPRKTRSVPTCAYESTQKNTPGAATTAAAAGRAAKSAAARKTTTTAGAVTNDGPAAWDITSSSPCARRTRTPVMRSAFSPGSCISSQRRLGSPAPRTGAYRRLLVKPDKVDFSFVRYSDPKQDLTATDLVRLSPLICFKIYTHISSCSTL